MKIVFRTDASIQIGTGHVMRCLTLADELTRQGHECRFVCREHNGHLGDLISSKGYDLVLLPAPVEDERHVESDNSDNYAAWLGVLWQEDARQTLHSIGSLKADWLVVDHYAVDAEWEKKLVHAVSSIMVIDDLANRAHVCALLLDQNLGREHEDYEALVPDTCERLIGPDYALLRPEFSMLRNQSLARRKTPELKRILVTLGGVDRDNVTGQLLTVLASSRLPSSTVIDVVMGKTAPYLKEVEAQAEDLPFQVTVNVGVTDMAERMCKADLAIGAAGSTSWERCCMGLPTITLVLAENQQLIGEALDKSGAGLMLDIAQFASELSKLVKRFSESPDELHNHSRVASEVCDGVGVKRVTSYLLDARL